MSGAQTRIYVADDEAPNLMLVERTLASFKFETVTFKDGASLLEAVEKDGKPDLIITDVRMPGVNGFEVCKRLKANPGTRHIPIILVTGLNEMKDKVRGLEEGADDFLQKPFHPVELRARAKSLLRLKRLHDLLENENERLEEVVQARTIELAEANTRLSGRLKELERAHTRLEELRTELESLNLGLVTALEKANELNDTDTGNHIRRCAPAPKYWLVDMACPKIRANESECMRRCMTLERSESLIRF